MSDHSIKTEIQASLAFNGPSSGLDKNAEFAIRSQELVINNPAIHRLG